MVNLIVYINNIRFIFKEGLLFGYFCVCVGEKYKVFLFIGWIEMLMWLGSIDEEWVRFCFFRVWSDLKEWF